MWMINVILPAAAATQVVLALAALKVMVTAARAPLLTNVHTLRRSLDYLTTLF